MQPPIQHPEVQQLRQRCNELRMELSARITQWHQLSVIERPQLLALYDKEFGSLELQRQRIAFDSSKLFRKIELLSLKVNRGETLTAEIVGLVSVIVEKEFERIASSEQRVASSEQQTSSNENGTGNEVLGTTNADLQPLYRAVVKKLHPDAVGDDPQLKQMWERAQAAYVDKDVRQLQNLLDVLAMHDENDAITMAWGVERWKLEEKRLSQRLRMENRKLERLKREEPFSIATKIEDQDWVAQHRSDLTSEIATQESVFEERQRLYHDLTAHLGEVTPQALQDDEKKTFDNDFMENTYFGGR